MRRRVVFASVAVALLALAALGVSFVSWRSADQLVHPAREALAATPSDVGVPFEPVSFSAGSLRLAGWWMPAPEARGVVVFLHGYGDSKDQSLEVAPFLHRAGYSVLAFDFRAHGQSEGEFTTVGLDEVEDVAAAVAFARARDPANAARVALLGFSMGGATAINAAAELDVDALVTDSAFASLTNIASNSITHFTDLPKYPFGPLSVVFAGWMVGKDVGENEPVRALARVEEPVLVIQGEADVIAFPDDDGRALRDAAAVGELWLVPDAAHVASVRAAPSEYEARVLAFLDEHVR